MSLGWNSVELVEGIQLGVGFYQRKFGLPFCLFLGACSKEPHTTHTGDIPCDAGRLFDYSCYYVTVIPSGTV